MSGINKGAIKFGTTSLGRIIEFNFDEEPEFRDITVQGDATRVEEISFKNTTGSVTLRMKKDDQGQLLIKQGATLEMSVAPDGFENGNQVYSGTIQVRKVSRTFPLEEDHGLSFDWKALGTGELTVDVLPRTH